MEGRSCCDIKMRRVCPHCGKLGRGFLIPSADQSKEEWICPKCDKKVEIVKTQINY